jgi:hypothetical protein
MTSDKNIYSQMNSILYIIKNWPLTIKTSHLDIKNGQMWLKFGQTK